MIPCKILSKNNTFFNPDASQSVTMLTAIFTDDAEERRARHAFCALDFQHTNVPLMNAATPDVDFMPKSDLPGNISSFATFESLNAVGHILV